LEKKRKFRLVSSIQRSFSLGSAALAGGAARAARAKVAVRERIMRIATCVRMPDGNGRSMDYGEGVVGVRARLVRSPGKVGCFRWVE
jgi:hypothetical protein